MIQSNQKKQVISRKIARSLTLYLQFQLDQNSKNKLTKESSESRVEGITSKAKKLSETTKTSEQKQITSQDRTYRDEAIHERGTKHKTNRVLTNTFGYSKFVLSSQV